MKQWLIIFSAVLAAGIALLLIVGVRQASAARAASEVAAWKRSIDPIVGAAQQHIADAIDADRHGSQQEAELRWDVLIRDANAIRLALLTKPSGVNPAPYVAAGAAIYDAIKEAQQIPSAKKEIVLRP
jgi:hypothetical protein